MSASLLIESPLLTLAELDEAHAPHVCGEVAVGDEEVCDYCHEEDAEMERALVAATACSFCGIHPEHSLAEPPCCGVCSRRIGARFPKLIAQGNA